jgi:small subunit ribosomal protein S17
MSDDETKKDETTEEPQAQDEAAQGAGPAAEETPSDAADTSEAASNSESSPPSEEAPEAEQDSADPAAPGREAEEAAGTDQEPDPESELPWKERRRLAKSRRPRKTRAADPEERKAERAEERRRKAALRRKQRAAAKSERTGGTGTTPAERTPNAAKVRQGIVVSDRGEKSITVRIDIARRHPVYEKIVRTTRTLHAHDERNEAGEGDMVRVVETRPLSKTKRWRLVEVIEKAK